jgi:hypothetical protein
MPKIIIDNDIHTLTELEPNLYHWHYKAIELQLKDYMLVYNIGIDIYKSTGEKTSVITSHDLTFSFASETWDFIVDKNSDFSFINAQAVVVKQLHLRVLTRIVSRIRKRAYKFQIFPTYDDALVWIKQQKEQE